MGDPRTTAADVAAKLAAGEVTSVEVAQLYLARIAEVDDRVPAILHVDHDGTLADAAESDARRARSEARGPHEGVPNAVTPVLATRGLPTTCGSKIVEGW